MLADGSVVTWGPADWSGDSSEVQDGCVVTWGPADWGGDSSEVQDQLKQAAVSWAHRSLRLRPHCILSGGERGRGLDGMGRVRWDGMG